MRKAQCMSEVLLPERKQVCDPFSVNDNTVVNNDIMLQYMLLSHKFDLLLLKA